jgi:hypothetical protein
MLVRNARSNASTSIVPGAGCWCNAMSMSAAAEYSTVRKPWLNPRAANSRSISASGSGAPVR